MSIKQDLAIFKNKINFPDIKVPDDIQNIINCTRQQLKTLDKEELCIYQIKLSQYSLYIKIQMNQLKANVDWCEANINSIIGREIKNCEGLYGFKEKEVYLKRNDQHAKALEEERLSNKAKITIIEDLDKKIEFLSNSMKNLLFVKNRKTS